jgi:hypothetical protein
VFQNGVLLKGGGTDYTATSGTSVVLTTGASVSDVIEIIVYDVFSVGNFFNRTDSDSRFVRHDSATAGIDNFIAGNNAGDAITSGGNQNTLVGNEAGTAITTGDRNTAVGFEALKTATTAQYNVAVGYQALENNIGNGNTAVGDQALEANTDGINNTAVGDDAGVSVTSGDKNTFVGALAGDAVTTTDSNTAMGYNAGSTNQTGTRTTFIGDNAGANSTVSDNTFIGQNSGQAVTTGDANTIIGRFDGNSGGLDIRTVNNNVVFSDGDGNIPVFYRQDGSEVWRYSGVVASYFAAPTVTEGTGGKVRDITFEYSTGNVYNNAWMTIHGSVYQTDGNNRKLRLTFTRGGNAVTIAMWTKLCGEYPSDIIKYYQDRIGTAGSDGATYVSSNEGVGQSGTSSWTNVSNGTSDIHYDTEAIVNSGGEVFFETKLLLINGNAPTDIEVTYTS